MKIEARCRTCGRTFLLSQIGPDSDTPGRCPFCGRHFARHYSTILVEAVADAERDAARFIRSLGLLQDMDTGFDIDVEGFLEDVARQVRAPVTPSASSK